MLFALQCEERGMYCCIHLHLGLIPSSEYLPRNGQCISAACPISCNFNDASTGLVRGFAPQPPLTIVCRPRTGQTQGTSRSRYEVHACTTPTDPSSQPRRTFILLPHTTELKMGALVLHSTYRLCEIVAGTVSSPLSLLKLFIPLLSVGNTLTKFQL